MARSDDPVEASMLGKQRAMKHQLMQWMVDALLDQIRRREIGEHGHAEQLERAIASAPHSCVERLAVERMHGEELGAGRSDRGGRALDRRLDVEQLGIDEHRPAGRRQLLRQGEAASEQELEPDLVDADAVLERADQLARLGDARHVERDDQLFSTKCHADQSICGTVERVTDMVVTRPGFC